MYLGHTWGHFVVILVDDKLSEVHLHVGKDQVDPVIDDKIIQKSIS